MKHANTLDKAWESAARQAEEKDRAKGLKAENKFFNIKKGGNMPGFDQTGPMGQGPMSGRKLGRCSNYGAGRQNQPPASGQTVEPLFPERELGFGRGRGGRGRGLGLQNRFRGG